MIVGVFPSYYIWSYLSDGVPPEAQKKMILAQFGRPPNNARLNSTGNLGPNTAKAKETPAGTTQLSWLSLITQKKSWLNWASRNHIPLALTTSPLSSRQVGWHQWKGPSLCFLKCFPAPLLAESQDVASALPWNVTSTCDRFRASTTVRYDEKNPALTLRVVGRSGPRTRRLLYYFNWFFTYISHLHTSPSLRHLLLRTNHPKPQVLIPRTLWKQSFGP